MKTALIFPGQGSQYVKMGHDFYSKYDVSRDIYERLNESIGRNLSKLIFSGETPILDRWLIQDESGNITLMSIERYEENISLGEMQFNIQLEIERRRN